MPVCIVLLNQFAPNGGGGRTPWFSASSMSCFTASFAVPSEGGEKVWVGECKALVGVGVSLGDSEVSGFNGPGRKLTLDLCLGGDGREAGRDGGAGKGEVLEEIKRTKESVGE